MSKRKNHSFSDYAVGIFMLSVLALLAYFTIVISGIDLVTGRERQTLVIAFDEIGGVKAHDTVMYRGTKVGTVKRVDLAETGLLVTLDVDKSVRLRADYRASVCNLSLLGGNYLLLEEGTGEVIDLAAAGTLKGESPTDWMRDVSRIAQNLNDLTSAGELRAIVTNFQAMSERANALVARIERGEGFVGRMLSSDESLYNDLQSAVADSKTTMSNAAAIAAKLNDAEILASVREGLVSFKNACESLDLGPGVKTNAQETVAYARSMMAALDAAAQRLDRGESTLGKLTSDNELYEEIRGLLRDCRQVLDNYRDTAPITTFSSLATGAL